MRFMGEWMNIKSEPTGALGLAGLKKMVKTGQIKSGSKVGVVLTGGNVDMADYAKYIQ